MCYRFELVRARERSVSKPSELLCCLHRQLPSQVIDLKRMPHKCDVYL